jgi:hypothetical protein
MLEEAKQLTISNCFQLLGRQEKDKKNQHVIDSFLLKINA